MHLVPEMPESTDLTDSEWCAELAVAALRAGRTDLGVELAILARRAKAAAAKQALFGVAGPRDVPLIGSTRDERPRHEHTKIMRRPFDLSDAQSHAPQLCMHLLEVNGSRRPCQQPIVWSNGYAENGKLVSGAGWYHLDPEINDHQGVVDSH